MKRLRLFLAGLVVLLVSGVLTPVSFANPETDPTDTSGVKFETFKNINSTGMTRNPANLQLCNSGVVDTIDEYFNDGRVLGSNCGYGEYFMVHFFGYISYPTTRTVTFAGQSDDGFYATVGGTPSDARFSSISGEPRSSTTGA